MLPNRGNRGWFRVCDKGGDVGRGPGRRCRGLWRGGVVPKGVSGDTKPLGGVDMMVGGS